MKLTLKEKLLGRGKLAKIVMPLFWGLLAVVLLWLLFGCATQPPSNAPEPVAQMRQLTTTELFARNGSDLSTWPAEDVQIYMSRVHGKHD